MKNTLTQFSRIFVGILFIISGLIKLNDPIGFSYKLTEYFSEPVFNMPIFTPFALAIALFLVILEVVLGIALLIGFKTKFTINSLLLLTVLFTFLTFYSAYFNVVKDCGCFGDALKLTPWQSFTKDIVLLFFILILFFNKNLIRPLFSSIIQNSLIILGFLACCFMGYWVLNHNPIKDFRPFAVGKNIEEGMIIPKNAVKSVTEMNFIYEVNSVKKEFTDKQLNLIPKDAKFIDRIDKVLVEGYKPPIHDFAMELDGSDYKSELLLEPKLMIFVTYDLEKANKEGLSKLNELETKAKLKGYKVIAMSGSNAEMIQKFKKEFNFKFEVYFCDATALKTIERANPSIVILEKGTVKQKVHYNDINDLKL